MAKKAEGPILTSSPVIRKAPDAKVVMYDFPSAVSQMIQGRRVTRDEWHDTTAFGAMREGWLEINLQGRWHIWKVSDGDMTATDWIVLEEAN